MASTLHSLGGIGASTNLQREGKGAQHAALLGRPYHHDAAMVQACTCCGMQGPMHAMPPGHISLLQCMQRQGHLLLLTCCTPWQHTLTKSSLKKRVVPATLTFCSSLLMGLTCKAREQCHPGPSLPSNSTRVLHLLYVAVVQVMQAPLVAAGTYSSTFAGCCWCCCCCCGWLRLPGCCTCHEYCLVDLRRTSWPPELRRLHRHGFQKQGGAT